MNDLNSTPVASRYSIGFFGKRNAGKSSLINAITGQNTALISDVAGTTTDPVYKTMELLPLGPVVFIDTAGLDDIGELGLLRVEKTYEVLRKTDFAIVVADIKEGIDSLERDFVDQLKKRGIPSILILNKMDHSDASYDKETLAKDIGIPVITVSALKGFGIEEIKKQIILNAKTADEEIGLVNGLIEPGDLAVLVTPIDKAAPKGRLILPQQQTIRDIIESDAMAVVTKEHELRHLLTKLKDKPKIVITDSQAFLKVDADTPSDIALTSFSILFARQKGDLAEMVRGIKRIESLKNGGGRVLIAEGCTHHRQSDDIGTVKIPRWIRQIAGSGIDFSWSSGASYPKDVETYDVIVHCGGCMLNHREMQYRMAFAREHGVYITNYGLLIAYVHGILKRALAPFPAALLAFEEEL